MKHILAATAISVLLMGFTANTFAAPAEPAEEQVQTHEALGVVKTLDYDNNRVTLVHEPVPSLNWPAMTMGFAVADDVLLDDLQVGQKVKFEFVEGEKGKFVITHVYTQDD